MGDEIHSIDSHAMLGRTCRHYSPLGETCRIGHPIKKIVTAANGGSNFGIAYMLPCRPGPDRKAECPQYNPQTDAEVEADNQETRKAMDRFLAAGPAIANIRSTMVAGNIGRQIVDCPFCNHPRAFHVTCAVGYNNHLHGKCAECGEGFIE